MGTFDVEEERRLQAVRTYAILDTPPETAFDRLTHLAADLFDVPMVVLTIVDRERQWFKSRYGIQVDETTRDVSFCAHVIKQSGVLEVEDASLDPRFADNPLVIGPSRVRFYAVAPMISPEGARLGAFGILDRRVRRLSEVQSRLLIQLAATAMDEIALRSVVQALTAGAGGAARASFDVHRRLRFITEQLPAILWTTDRGLIFTSAMGSGLSAMARSPADVVGQSLGDFVASSPDAWRHVAAHRAALEGRGSSTDVWFKGRAYQTRVDPLRDRITM